MVDIARGAGTSPATFYQYFPEVESAILVLAEEMALEGRVLTDIVRDGSWKGKAGLRHRRRRSSTASCGFWEDHRSVLRVVDLATEEGDQRFRNIRTRLLNEVVVALADVIARLQADGRHPADLDPLATAGVLVAMLAHVSAHRYGFEFWGIRTDDTRNSHGPHRVHDGHRPEAAGVLIRARPQPTDEVRHPPPVPSRRGGRSRPGSRPSPRRSIDSASSRSTCASTWR